MRPLTTCPSIRTLAVQIFRNDDEGYLRWVRENFLGYLINAEPSLTPSGYPKFDEAGCGTISGQPRAVVRGPARHQGLCSEQGGTTALGAYGSPWQAHDPADLRPLRRISPRRTSPAASCIPLAGPTMPGS